MGAEYRARSAFKNLLTVAELSRFSWQPEQDEHYGRKWPVIGSQYFSGIGHLWLVYDSKDNPEDIINATYVATVPVRENCAADFLESAGLKSARKGGFSCWGMRHAPNGRGQAIIILHGAVPAQNPLPARVIAETDDMLRQYLRPARRVHYA